MTETIAFLLLTTHALLGRMGGWLWKGWRRFVLPACTGGLLLWASVLWWRVGLVALTEVWVNSLPYGSKHPLPTRIVAALAFGLPAVVLNLACWWAPLVTGVVFGTLYAASRRWNWVWWGIVEFLTFGVQGAMLIIAVLLPGGP